MAELADALGSGSSVRKDMGVQVPLRPPLELLSSIINDRTTVARNMVDPCFEGLEKTD
jgi:hypothetical protein